MKIRRTCPQCNETKFFWDMSKGALCKECEEIESRKKYSTMSREELLSELEEYKYSKDDLPFNFIFFMGYLITYLYTKFMENPHIFSSSFWGNGKIVFYQIFEALAFILLSIVAAAIFIIAYIAATHKFESRNGKIISTIFLIIAMIFLYVCFLTK